MQFFKPPRSLGQFRIALGAVRFLREVHCFMDQPTLTGSQKTFLRGLGQRLEPALKVGKGGLTLTFFGELQRHLRTSELVKLRFLGSDRDQQAAFCVVICETCQCACVGAVGHTALFYLPNPDSATRRIPLPE
jgi:RNA-binding protein